MIRSAENDEPLLLALPVLPAALYGVDDEADSEFCSDCRNCCTMSAVLVVPEELEVLSVEDELSAGGGPPWPP